MDLELVFLKLGGSLITDKQQTAAARFDVIRRLAGEISAAKQKYPQQSILLGHGSGSFGHVPAKKFATRDGIKDENGWLGFLEVWRAALTLNRIVTDALHDAAVPVLAFPPSAALLSSDHRVDYWNIEPIRLAIQAGLVPLVYGDVVFDRVRSATIFSTEDLFEYLAVELHPKRILLAGSELGVWADFHSRQSLYSLITPSMLPEILPTLGVSSAIDVTGGMASKVVQCLNLVQAIPGLEIWIFCGSQPGFVERALLGEPVGTIIRSDVSG
jgi:isopentenyl phosphate kinase